MLEGDVPLICLAKSWFYPLCYSTLHHVLVVFNVLGVLVSRPHGPWNLLPSWWCIVINILIIIINYDIIMIFLTTITILTIIMIPIMIIISAIVVIIIRTPLLVNVLYPFSFIWQLLLSTLEVCPSLNAGNHNITQMTTMTMKTFSRIIWFVQPSQPSAAKTRRHRRSGHFTLSQKLDLQSW